MTLSPSDHLPPPIRRVSASRLTLAVALVVAVLASMLVLGNPARAASGFTVRDGRLVDANGQDFVMRGVNIAHAWYPDKSSSFADSKALGANTVRVVLASGQQWTRTSKSDVAAIVARCKQNRLVCVLEVHDTTGYGEEGGAATLSQAADFWIGLKDVLVGQEQYVIVNIGNEPHGNSGYQRWAADTTGAIQRLRRAGFEHTLMVDAPNWGQDWSFTMRDNAAEVFAGDPARNTVFSVHMYGVFDTATEVRSYLDAFVTKKLPIVVGEFGHDHGDGNPDESAIMSTSVSRGIGYLGWSWSGNGSGVEYLDLVQNFDGKRLTSWGQRFFNGADGVARTSKEASVFGRPVPPPTTVAPPVSPPTTVRPPVSPPTTVSPPVSPPTTVAPPVSPPTTVRPPVSPPTTVRPPVTPAACRATYVVRDKWDGGFVADVTITNNGPAVDTWTVQWAFPGNETVREAWNISARQSGSTFTGTNVSYNGTVPTGSSVSMGFKADASSNDGTPAAILFNGTRCSR